MIYIPLCFYLYSVHSALIASVSCNLHSTMFLLIRKKEVFYKEDYLIYIPLCFYLYKAVGVLKEADKQIYIPLCFYLYWLASQADMLANDIYIPLCFYLYWVQGFTYPPQTRFTFRYVSTYTRTVSATG